MQSQHNVSQYSRKKLHQPKKKKSWWKRILFTLLTMILIIFLAGIGAFWYYAKDAPPLDEHKLEDTISSNIFDRNGQLIMTLGEKKRETIEANQIPPLLKNAIISIEDKRFEHHPGIDIIRITGSAISNFKGNQLQGGSTLTQQLIKLSYFSTKEEDQTIWRKAQEAWLSLQLERKKSKDEILMYYINKVYMANGLYGMATASEVYFGKPLQDLNLAQAALLAGMPQAPNDYDPYTEPEAATDRRNLVLTAMYQDNKISKSDYEQALNTPVQEGLLPLTRNSENIKIIDNYLKEVIEEVEKNTEKDVYRDGMDIYTNLDMAAQEYLYQLVNTDELIQFPSDDFQTAVTIIDVHNGQVMAQIGGRKIPDDVRFGENLAVKATRDVGSTVKPITEYAPAIEYLDYSTAQKIIDEPYVYPDAKNIEVKNYDKAHRGAITLRQALVDSRNVPAVKTLQAVGLDQAAEFLNKLGIHYEDFNYANAISGEISSLNLAAAYASFANGGTYYKPYYVQRVVYPDGREKKFRPEGEQVMKESTAFLMTDMLKDVIEYGTGQSAKIEGLPQAGKTGTSNYPENVAFNGPYGGVPDITFVGYTTNYSIAVWTGNANYLNAITPEQTQIAMYIYRYLMTFLSEGIEVTDWTPPENVYQQNGEYFVSGSSNTTHSYEEDTSSDKTTTSSYYNDASTSSPVYSSSTTYSSETSYSSEYNPPSYTSSSSTVPELPNDDTGVSEYIPETTQESVTE